MKKRRQSPAKFDCLNSLPQEHFVEDLPLHPVYRMERIMPSCINYGNWSDHLPPHDEVLATVALLAHYGDAGAPQFLGGFSLLGERCFAE